MSSGFVLTKICVGFLCVGGGTRRNWSYYGVGVETASGPSYQKITQNLNPKRALYYTSFVVIAGPSDFLEHF
jgi:hypothetical protein